jgi:hypothetical protein
MVLKTGIQKKILSVKQLKQQRLFNGSAGL